MGVVLIFLSFSVFADTGYVYEGDMNNDGIADTLQSGPSSLFGKGNGPFVLKLSVNNNEYNSTIIILNVNGFYLERTTKGNRIWSYYPVSMERGILRSTELNSNFSIVDKEFSVNDNRLRAVLTEKYLVKFRVVEDYNVPQHPCGKQWGKGEC